jgi:hypothetical protein
VNGRVRLGAIASKVENIAWRRAVIRNGFMRISRREAMQKCGVANRRDVLNEVGEAISAGVAAFTTVMLAADQLMVVVIRKLADIHWVNSKQ